MEYTVILEPDEKGRGYTVVVPALPGCVTQGKTRKQAIERAKEAIALYLESLRADGQPLPEEKRPVQMLKVAV